MIPLFSSEIDAALGGLLSSIVTLAVIGDIKSLITTARPIPHYIIPIINTNTITSLLTAIPQILDGLLPILSVDTILSLEGILPSLITPGFINDVGIVVKAGTTISSQRDARFEHKAYHAY